MRAAVFAFSCLAATCAPETGCAQTPTNRQAKEKKNKHDVKMDALSRATLERWEKMEYHLGRAGVRSVSFTVKVDSKNPLGDAEATGKYTFNGKKSTLKWSNAAQGDMLAQRGWSPESFDRLFIPDSHLRALKGAKLTARKKGDNTIIEVEGETKSGYKNFQYDKAGVGRKFTFQVSNPAIGDTDAIVAVKYRKIRGKHVRTGWSLVLKTPMGVFRGVVTIENKKVGKYHVYGTVVEKQTMGDQPFGSTTLTFSEYKINGAITEPKKPGATSKPTGKKPASKPGKDKKAAVKKLVEKTGPPKD
jgi:hypothetical protein